jgi:hypothetical protein
MYFSVTSNFSRKKELHFRLKVNQGMLYLSENKFTLEIKKNLTVSTITQSKILLNEIAEKQ